MVTVTVPSNSGAPSLFRRCPAIAASTVLREDAGNRKAPSGKDSEVGLGPVTPSLDRKQGATSILQTAVGQRRSGCPQQDSPYKQAGSGSPSSNVQDII